MIWELLLALLSLFVCFVGIVVMFIGAFIFSELKKRILGSGYVALGFAIYIFSPWIRL